jgi:hypothetical protein
MAKAFYDYIFALKEQEKIRMLNPDKEDRKLIVKKEYILTQKQIKAFLEIEGDIDSIGLFEGLSPNDEQKGKSKDLQKFYINVTETTSIPRNTKDVAYP